MSHNKFLEVEKFTQKFSSLRSNTLKQSFRPVSGLHKLFKVLLPSLHLFAQSQQWKHRNIV